MHISLLVGKIHKCGVCSYSSKYVSAVERHLLTHTGERPYECVKPFKCPICGRGFTEKSSLRRHAVTHFR
ncbi:UNVERIFIED_CONTAM: Zbtb10 [Trichonephila clavipes]